MPEDIKEKPQSQVTTLQHTEPLIFISHDSRDADIAEAFSTLLRRTTAGMLKTFRSSDKKGTEGIEFGDDWYKRLMSALESASDVICLFTERSLERPWILYEAGVAKGKIEKPVLGIALGVPLSRVGIGPFYQFENSDDSEEALTKLVMQLAKRVPALEPDPEVVQTQVHTFKESVGATLAHMKKPDEVEKESPSEASTAKLLEELKLIVRELPLRVERHFSESSLHDSRRRRPRFNPMFFDELIPALPQGPSDPIVILIFASLFRDEVPWFYELGREAYESFNNRGHARQHRAVKALRSAMNLIFHSPIGQELFGESEESYLLMMETRGFVERALERLHEDPHEP